ncbi:MAG: hypothetical protein AAGL98_13900, partial [Planctomycetota bacterium]
LAIESDDEGSEAFRQLIRQARTNPDAFYRFVVPDLVTLYGTDTARSLLKQVVVLPVESIEIEVGDATRHMATQVALEQIDALAVPRWALVSSIDEPSVALYEALDEKFAEPQAPAAGASRLSLMDRLKSIVTGGAYVNPSASGHDGYTSYYQNQARVVYLLGLVAMDRIDDATALVQTHYVSAENNLRLPYGLMETLQKTGQARPVFDFVERTIDSGGAEVFWPTYIRLGAQVEASDRVREKIEAALGDLEGERRAELLEHVVSARLAADEIERGVEALREQIKLAAAANDPNDAAALSGYATLARIGQLEDRDDWLDEGLQGALSAFTGPQYSPSRHDWERRAARSILIKVLLEADRGPEAERLLVDAVGNAVQQ